MAERLREQDYALSCYQRLLSLDHIAENLPDEVLAERLSRTKELIREQKSSAPFVLSAHFVRRDPEKDETTVAIDYWDERHTVRTIRFLAADRRVLASGAVPWEMFMDYEMPLRFIFVKFREVSENPRNDFVETNVLEIDRSANDIAFVEIEDAEGTTCEAIDIGWLEGSEE